MILKHSQNDHDATLFLYDSYFHWLRKQTLHSLSLAAMHGNTYGEHPKKRAFRQKNRQGLSGTTIEIDITQPSCM